MQRLEILIIVMALLAVGLYSLSWLFAALDWQGGDMLKIAAIAPFLAGGIMLIIYNRGKNQERRRREIEEEDDF